MEQFVHTSPQALADFLADLERDGTQLHCMEVFQEDRQVIRWALSPYRCDDKRELYSLSKSFTSTALGAAYDRGLLRPDDSVLSYFPEYAPLCKEDERWQRMRLRHLMTMADGHETCVMPQMAFAQDSARAFFEASLAYEPGSTFVYNTGATCLLAEAVRRATGMPVPQWLAQTVFAELGIVDFSWETCLDGRCDGGTGLRLSCDDVARLGLLYLHEGQWNGKQVLSREWVRMATGKQKDNVRNGSPDWTAGYGFQFWRNARQGFRGDGAFGQLCVVIPERRLVAALLVESVNAMPLEVERLWTFLDEMNDKPGNDRPKAAYQPAGTLQGAAMDTGWRTMQKNPAGILSLRVQADEDRATVDFCTETGVQRLTAPSGQWQDNSLYLKEFFPNLTTMMPRRQPQLLRLSAAAHWEAGGLVVECRMRNAPHAFLMRLTLTDGKLCMRLETGQAFPLFGAEKCIEEK